MDAASLAIPAIAIVEQIAQTERLLETGGEGRTPAFPLRTALPQIVPLLRSGHLPPATLPLVAGTLAAWGSIKNYALGPYWELGTTLEEEAASLPAGLLAAADRTAPLGVCDQWWHAWSDARPTLVANEGRGEAWRVMRLAVDALAGGSREALDALEAMKGGATWRAWVREVVLRVAERPVERTMPREDDPRITTLDALDGARSQLDAKTLARARRAWKQVDTARRKPQTNATPEPVDDELRSILADAEAEEGPFLHFRPSTRVSEGLMGAGWPLLVGFRHLYGIALVREALPDVRVWIARELPSA
jgi:hypothetical protein